MQWDNSVKSKQFIQICCTTDLC